MTSRHYLIIASAIACLSSSAQQADLARVNGAFAGRARLHMDDERRLVVDHHDVSGLFRQDMAYIARLDAQTIAYSEEEHAVVVKCAGDFPQCIEKEIFKLNSISHTNRMNLPLEADEATRIAVVQGLRDAITSEQARLDPTAGETRTPQRRKK